NLIKRSYSGPRFRRRTSTRNCLSLRAKLDQSFHCFSMTKKRSECERRESVIAHHIRIRATFEQHAHCGLVPKERGLHQRRRAVSITRIEIAHTRQQTQQLVDV